jgi:hypothetical protein
MALKADDAHDRGEQLVLVTVRLTALIEEESRRMEARLPPLGGAEADEKTRLANAYRLELARLKHDHSLIEGAGADTLFRLRDATQALHAAIAAHEIALHAVKVISEGLVQSMAEEIARLRNGEVGYAASGAVAQPSGPIPTVLDKSA